MDSLTKNCASAIQDKIFEPSREAMVKKVSLYIAHKILSEIEDVPLLWVIKKNATNSFKSWILEKN